MDLVSQLTEAQYRFLQRQKVGRLATVDEQGRPHVIPICYVFDGGALYSSIDEKPKRREARQLQRLKNIGVNPSVCLVLDRYTNNWTTLCWLQVRGRASEVKDGAEHQRAVALLRGKYPQYRTMDLDIRPVIKIQPERVVAWGKF